MARKYAAVDPNIWNQTEFRRLSDDARLLFFYTTTGPHSEANAYVLPMVILCEDLKWDVGRANRAFKALEQKPYVLYDGAARVVYVAEYWEHDRNKIPNGNVAAYIARHLYHLPNSPLKAKAIDDLRATNWFSERVEAVLVKWKYTPQQDDAQPDPRQGSLLGDSAGETPAAAKPKRAPREATKLPQDWEPTAEMLAYASRNGVTGPALDYLTKNFRRYWSGDGKPMKDWQATWENAVDRDVKQRAERGGSNGANGSGNGHETFGVMPKAPVNWESRLKLWRKNPAAWLGSWGPKPGEPHCEVPPELLQ